MFWKITTCLFILLANPMLSAEQNKAAEESSILIQEEEQSEEDTTLHHYENLFVGGLIGVLVLTVTVAGTIHVISKLTCSSLNDGIDIEGRVNTPIRSPTPNPEER